MWYCCMRKQWGCSPVLVPSFLRISLWCCHLLFAMILISISGCSSQNITPADVDCSHLVTYVLNKEDVSPITLPPLPPSTTLWPSPLGWTVAGFRKSCLMVFWVWRLSCGCCSLAGCCVTDSGRSLVPSPTYSACLARLTWISWWSITAILDSSRYSWKTCGEKNPTHKSGPSIHSFFILVFDCALSCGGLTQNLQWLFLMVDVEVSILGFPVLFWLHANLTSKIIHSFSS